MYILCIYNIRHACGLEFCFFLSKMCELNDFWSCTQIHKVQFVTRQIAQNVNCIVWQNHKSPVSLLLMKVNDKWAHLIIWATIHKLLCQTLYFSKKNSYDHFLWVGITYLPCLESLTPNWLKIHTQVDQLPSI